MTQMCYYYEFYAHIQRWYTVLHVDMHTVYIHKNVVTNDT